jgi:hypothetical protein
MGAAAAGDAAAAEAEADSAERPVKRARLTRVR